MYPPPEVLQEVGRVTIAGSRVELELSRLWEQLDPAADPDLLRTAPAGRARDQVRRLARERLDGQLLTDALDLVDAIEAVAERRNAVVHQDWVLRGADAMRPVADLVDLDPEQTATYLDEWEREAKDSQAWQQIPSRSRQLLPPEPLEDVLHDLREVDRTLRRTRERIVGLLFTVASAREVGKPSGWIGPTTRP